MQWRAMRAAAAMAAGLALSSCSLILPLSDEYTFGSDAGDGGIQYDAGALSDAALDAALDAGCPMRCGGECTDTATDPEHCGSCTNSCSAPENGTATCAGGTCGFDCDEGYARVLGECVVREAPRPVAPLSTSVATSRRPTFQWELAARSDGARIEICEDRACTSVLQTIDAVGTAGRPSSDLPPGTVFWRLRSLESGVPGTVTSPTWQLHIGARSADGDVDTSWGTRLDVNGDGFVDVAIGAPSVSSEDGAVYVYLGGPSGLDATPQILVGPIGAGDRFGKEVASAGDVDGDGFADLVVGVELANGGDGAVYVYRGSPTGIDDTARVLDGPVAGAAYFGHSVASAGDVDRDGFADVLVGARLLNYPASYDGALYLYRGSASGLLDTPQVIDGPAGLGERFGYSVASAGDVDGDGYAEVVVGAIDANSGDGAAYVYWGSPAGLDTTTRQRLEGAPGTDANFGEAVASAGDVDGDGYAEIIVGARSMSFSDGSAYVYGGSAAGLGATPVRLDGPSGEGGGFGDSLAGAHDFDGDGFADVVVGAPSLNGADGAVLVYRGSTGGLSGTPEVIRGVTGGVELFGAALASAGDIDADGFTDLIVGALLSSGEDGAVYIFRGSSAGVAGTSRRLPGPAGAGGHFGHSLARVHDFGGGASSTSSSNPVAFFTRRS